MLWTLALLKLWSEAAALPAYPAPPGPLAVYADAAPDVSRLLPHTRAHLDRLLKDSYGNQFETAHTSPYKTMVTQFPKQFVRLQSLPAHLSSPLTLGASYRVHTPHFFVDSRYRQESPPSATPTSFIVYGRQLQHQAEGYPTENRLNQDAVVLKNNILPFRTQYSRNEQRFQRLEENPQVHHPRSNVDIHNSQKENAHVKASCPNNNENVHLSFDTKPVLPLLDLSLLKPLNFENTYSPRAEPPLYRNEALVYVNEQRPKLDGQNIVKHSFEVTRGMPTNVHQPANHQVFETVVTRKETLHDGPVVMQIHETPNYIYYNRKHVPKNTIKSNEINQYNNLVHHSYEIDTSKKPKEFSSLQSSGENSAYQHQNKQQTSRDVHGSKNTQEVITPISINKDTISHHHIKNPVNDENRKDHKKNRKPFRQEDFNSHYNKLYPSIVKTKENIYPILRGNEHDVIISPTYKPHTARIIVDPGAHLQFMANINTIENSDGSQRTLPQNDHEITNSHNIIPQNHRIVENSKKVMMILSEKANDVPKEMHSHMEHASAELMSEEENDEQDFEKAYKQSAFGFPAFETNSEEIEKDIYNPNSYGNPHYSIEYDIVHSPYKENNQEIEDFNPSYKNSREMSKNNYISEYKIKRPEGLSNPHRNQDYYSQIYEQFRPANVKILNQNITKNQRPNTVYSAEDSRSSEMDYSQESNEGSIDSREKSSGKTRFVEPEFQYGFQPIQLDSELAAMATDLFPRQDDPGVRKKIYKMNWYIKKTTSTDHKPNS